jgi:hypothetical protein
MIPAESGKVPARVALENAAAPDQPSEPTEIHGVTASPNISASTRSPIMQRAVQIARRRTGMMDVDRET